MKLTKEQIQYIEDYLIKNEVKFWDVRIELLDHIASAVEEKMINNEMSFIKALSIVHQDFGNQLISPKYNDKYYLEKSLYQVNNGFKKHIRVKQKELGKKYRKKFIKTLKKQFLSQRIYIEFFLLLMIAFTIYSYAPKMALLSVFLLIVSFEVVKFIVFFRDYSFFKKSLQFNLAFSFSTLFYCWQYFIIKGYEALFPTKEDVEYHYLLLFYVFVFLFMRASLEHFIKFFKTYKERYKKLIINE